MLPRILISLVALLSVASAEVIVVSPSEVRIDGTNVGAVSDAFANHSARRSEIQTALAAFSSAKDAAKAQAEAALAETQQFAAAIISNAKALLVAPDATTIEKLTALIAQAETPAAARKRAELERQKAALEAELAKLPAP